MISDEDDNSTLVVKQKPEKHAARISDNDKANLLSSGEEEAETEEYTGDIFFNFSCFIVGNILVINQEAVVQECSVKKMFLKISQNSQENTVPESLF